MASVTTSQLHSIGSRHGRLSSSRICAARTAGPIFDPYMIIDYVI
jgi:hypothetical protein